ncbi:helix-turn-helix domain-containing protein [Clostridium botulinum]|uniref:helix-turn-helix domain-containing protein n=1 Tax=Clostridium botulinum TaxID=1491 RepID=UPI00077435D1|nr:helix-turn-helix transcriptional regulator [Clostridium botulinum]AUM92660.1 transcriptional regulator [Clostridium botulinum]NFB12110.1 XRE family transcriptional regulator [Clostridium botulinum]NFH60212.1 helix-turn-helix transcriptional regulator [Clostridium botulinum]NFJ87197.1 helix-turn-helix transcriptional regulator [Clostridium botulinum]NFV31301.1 helix-turn-helix transcriptional regulator [Clostridium botulinum]
MLKAVRKHKGIKQKDLANRLGITQAYLSKLENNSLYKINVNIDIIENLALELNICPIAVFLYFFNVNISCPFKLKKT